MYNDPTILKPERSRIRVRKIWAFDSEDDSKGNIKWINFYTGKKHYSFKDGASAVTFLINYSKISGDKGRSPITISATNLAYDMWNLFGESLFDRCEIVYWGGKFISAEMRNTRFKFLDTVNLWPISVEKMGILMGLKKMKFNPDSLRYCRRDTEITYQFTLRMQKLLNDLGCEMKNTLPSCGLDLFRRRYLRYPIQRPDEPDINQLKKAYAGGRVEGFYTSPVKGNIYYVDFNSLYGSVMLNTTYPNPNTFRILDVPSYDDFVHHEGVYCVTVQAPKDIQVPLLFCKTGKLIFPVGKFSGVYAKPELVEALRVGYKIIKFHWAYIYKKGEKYLSKYVDELMKRRARTKDKFSKDFFKLLTNSLYGKFCQNNEKPLIKKVTPEEPLPPYAKEFAGYYFVTEKGDYPRQSNYIWGIYTTSIARILWFRGATEIVNNGAKILYGDTDSLIYQSDKPIFSASEEPGALKFVIPDEKKPKEQKWGYFWFKQPKVYCLMSNDVIKYVAKGVPKKYAEKFFKGDTVVYDAPVKIKEGIRNDLKINVWESRTKELKGKYDKRKVCRDGSTEPWLFQEFYIKLLLSQMKKDTSAKRYLQSLLNKNYYNLDIQKIIATLLQKGVKVANIIERKGVTK